MKKLLVLALPLLLCGCQNKSVSYVNNKIKEDFLKYNEGIAICYSIDTTYKNKYYFTNLYYYYKTDKVNHNAYKLEYLSHFENDELIIWMVK